jgi:hypothetical protein
MKETQRVAEFVQRHCEKVYLCVSHFIPKPPVFLLIKENVSIRGEKRARKNTA